ncbi:MAG: tRNA (guanosine(46)-N7)-methyltransferase TrmB [Bacteriovoracaceae bacterium]
MEIFKNDTVIGAIKPQAHCYNPEFKYKHKNPYHDRLSEFDQFVMRDNEAEEFAGKWNQEIFKNNQPIHLEIGTGYGHFMHLYSEQNPDVNFVGLDFRFKRSFLLAKKLAKLLHQNFRYLRARGERIEFIFGAEELEKIFYFFPDPWPKKRHWKKRLFQAPFLNGAYKTLKPGGELIVKTDHDGYFEWMLECAKADPRFEMIHQSYDQRVEFPDHFLSSFETEFETLFISKGIKIKSLILKKI